jgi:STE24 endopeptidase
MRPPSRAPGWRVALGAATAVAVAGLLAVAADAALPTRVPAWTTAYFAPDVLERAALYGRGRDVAFVAASLLRLGFLTWLARAALRRPAQPPSARAAAAYAAAASLGSAAVALPVAWWSGWWWSRRFGMSTATLGQWLGDRGKAEAVALGGLLAVALVAHGAMRRWPLRWWLAAATGASLALAASALLAPTVLQPLFFRFHALPPGPLRASIVALAHRAGATSVRISAMDASTRTTAPNAYVEGLLGPPRIVLYDTLLRELPPREVLLVAAHELGHWRYRDLATGLAAGVAGVFATCWLLAGLLRSMVRSGDASSTGDPRALPALFLGVALLALLTLPLQSGLSRLAEVRADAFALRLTGDPAGFAAMQARLAARGLVDPAPPPLVQWALGDHPSPLQRVARARLWRVR